MRELVYYVAVSVDGFIADPDGDFSAFPNDPDTLRVLFDRYPETCPAPARKALGMTAAPRRFDTVLMGARTHQPALDAGWAGGVYPHLDQVVVTHRALPPALGVRTISGDVASQVAAAKDQPGRDIWLCGGADLATQLADQIDELQVKVNPVLLGAGVPLMRVAGPRSLTLQDSERLPGGVVLNTYRR